MRKTALLLVSLLLLGCSGGENSWDKITAPGFSGIGDLTIGLPRKEALSLLSGVESYSPHIFGYGGKVEDLEEVSGKSGTLNLKGERLEVFLTFYRDTLVLIETDWRGSNLLRDILSAKYGDTPINGKKSYYLQTWRGETATATYLYRSGENPDLYRRKTLERVTIVPTGRDIRRELRDYARKEEERRASERKEDLRNIW